MNRLIKGCLVLCASAVVVLSGCADMTAGMRVDGKSQQAVFTDQVLGNRLVVDNISTVQFDGKTRGVVSLSSQYGGDQHVQYRFYWYDDAGLEVNSKQAAWKKVIVHGFETISVSEVSINPNGKQFRVQIRQADE
jgi:uncharacterized protein YcfL